MFIFLMYWTVRYGKNFRSAFIMCVICNLYEDLSIIITISSSPLREHYVGVLQALTNSGEREGVPLLPRIGD